MSGSAIVRSKKHHKQQFVDVNVPKNKKLDTNKGKKQNLIYCCILVLLTLIVFSTGFDNQYTGWDDTKYVEENPLIEPFDAKTITEIFTSENLSYRYWMGNYHPLTMLSLNMTNAMSPKDENGKPKPYLFIVFNVFLHIINTLLVFLIIFKLFKNNNIAFFTALIFAVHTLHIESVSWIAERKDVLYTVFFLLALYTYIVYTETQKILHYFLTILLFAFSLLSKGQAVSLTITLILIDFITARKLFSPKVIIEKIPFLILSLIFGLIAIEAQKHGNALVVVNSMPFVNRIGVASFGFTMYLLKLILPVQLSAIYPYPDIINQTIPLYYWFGLLTVIAFVIGLYLSYKKNKLVFFALSFFVINIFLQLQLIPVGSAVYADRYAYIPSIGIVLLLAYLLVELGKKINKRLMFGVVITYVLLLSVLSVYRIQDWKNSFVFWLDVIEKQPKSVIAWNNLGANYYQLGVEFKENNNIDSLFKYSNLAVVSYQRAISRKPDYSTAYYNMAYAKRELGFTTNDTNMVSSAIADFNSALDIDLTFTEAYHGRGVAYDWLGKYDNAVLDFKTGLSYSPKNIDILLSLGIAKGKMGLLDEAINIFDEVIKIDPNSETAFSNRGLAKAYKSEHEAAIEDYSKALLLKIDGNTLYNRALSYMKLDKNEEALGDFSEAEKSNFKIPAMYFYKGIILMRLEQQSLACEAWQIAVSMGDVASRELIQKNCQ